MLKEPSIKTLFKESFPVAKPRLDGDMLASPISKRSSLVGTAFDYLLRFRLERSFDACDVRPWVAEEAVEVLNSGMIPCDSRKRSNANAKLEAARGAHRSYMDTGVAGDEVLGASLDLAQLDVIYRTGITYEFFDASGDDIADLRGMADVANRKFPMPSQTCYLNPTFGKGSSLVGGADADLIIDGRLIDIKTNRRLAFGQDMYNQLVGYYVLSLLGGVNGKDDVNITTVGIYYARYGLLHTIPTNGIQKKVEGGFMEAFVKASEEMFPRV